MYFLTPDAKSHCSQKTEYHSPYFYEGRKYLLLDNFLYEASDSLDRLDICE